MKIAGMISFWLGALMLYVWFKTRAKSKMDGEWDQDRGAAYFFLALYAAMIVGGILLQAAAK